MARGSSASALRGLDAERSVDLSGGGVTQQGQLPVAAFVDQFYAEEQAMGGRRGDTSSLVAPLER
jgi:hypothetical protein